MKLRGRIILIPEPISIVQICGQNCYKKNQFGVDFLVYYVHHAFW